MKSREKNRFSGHQTFAFRYGWLEKGYNFARQEYDFRNEDAIVHLGVGKNMVESIRYWCEMADIIDRNGKVTFLGANLLDADNGWDPYLEDNASLWLIHWKIITNSHYFTSGSALFSFLHKPEFDKRELAEAINRRLAANGGSLQSEVTLSRDIDCFVRCYAGTRRQDKKQRGEDLFDCPLQELNLIHPMNEGDMYRFSIGHKISLPPAIVGYALWEYTHKIQNRTSLRLQEALYHEYSPGQVFMLDENTMIDAINSLNAHPKWGRGFSFTESAGIALVHCTLKDGMDLLREYYREQS